MCERALPLRVGTSTAETSEEPYSADYDERRAVPPVLIYTQHSFESGLRLVCVCILPF